VDLADAFYARLKAKVEELEKDGGIGVLINNVGIANPVPDYVHELDEKETFDIIRVNIDGTIRMSRTVIPSLVRR
jgi:short-subunit dehydrogenase